MIGLFINPIICIVLVFIYLVVGVECIKRDRANKLKKAVKVLYKFSDYFERDFNNICDSLGIPYVSFSSGLTMVYIGNSKVVISEEDYR